MKTRLILGLLALAAVLAVSQASAQNTTISLVVYECGDLSRGGTGNPVGGLLASYVYTNGIHTETGSGITQQDGTVAFDPTYPPINCQEATMEVTLFGDPQVRTYEWAYDDCPASGNVGEWVMQIGWENAGDCDDGEVALNSFYINFEGDTMMDQ